MDKKKFSKKDEALYLFEYRLAELVRGSYQWYVKWYQTNPDTGELERKKRTFNMNREKDLSKREEIAAIQIERLNKLIPHGYPFRLPEKKTPKEQTPLWLAIQKAYEIKEPELRTRSRQAYSSFANIFTKWADSKDLRNLPVSSFSDELALDFMDDLQVERKLTNRTWNYYMSTARTFFYILEHRKFIKKGENPFTGMKKKKVPKNYNRTIPEAIKIKLAQYAQKHFPELYIIIQLIYYGHIRPAELRRMLISDIRFDKSQIFLTESQTKDKEARFITLPAHLTKQLRYLLKYPDRYRAFSTGLKPGMTKLHHAKMNKVHNRMIDEMKKKGILDKGVGGFTLYNWKHTGMSEINKFLDRSQIKDQAGHETEEMTEHYLNKTEIRQGYRNLPDFLN